jgi:hypothetical protein
MSLNSHDWLYITVTKDCTWCWKDTGAFPPGKLPDPGIIEAGHYGPFIPTQTGTVTFYSVMSGPCPPIAKGKTVAHALSTPHAIIVG